MHKYEHGGNIYEFSKQLNCKEEDILDLSSNINYIKPNPQFNFNTINTQPYPNYNKLYEKISILHNLKVEQIELYNGASSAIYSLIRNLNIQLCYIYSPAYLEYKKATDAFGIHTELINRFTDINHNIQANSLVIFVNPSTPEGSYYKLNSLLKQWCEKNCTIIIDESFLDFTSKSSATKFIQNYNKLYIIKSFTKFYSSAGVRLGAIFSQKENILTLKQKEPQWKLSVFDIHYMLHIFEDPNFIQVSKSINIANKEYLMQILKNSSFINNIFESSANYIMVQLNNITATKFQELLKPHKIMIRNCSNFDFLDESYIRLAVKSKQDLNRFQEALKKIEF